MSSPLFLQKLYSLHLDDAELPCQWCSNHRLFSQWKLVAIFTTDKVCCDWYVGVVAVLAQSHGVVVVVGIGSETCFFSVVLWAVASLLSSKIDSFLPLSQPNLFNSCICFLTKLFSLPKPHHWQLPPILFFSSE